MTELTPEPARTISWSRVLSLVVVLIYLVPCLFQPEPWLFIKVTLRSVLPFLAIWYPSRLAQIVSAGADDDPPVGLIVTLAWIVLLLPLLWAIVFARSVWRP